MVLGTSPLNIALSFVGLLIGALVGGLLSRWSAPATIGGAFFGGIVGSLLSELVLELPSAFWRQLGWGSAGGALVGLAFGGTFALTASELDAEQRLSGLGISLLVGTVAGAIAWTGFLRLRERWPLVVKYVRRFLGGAR